MTSMVSYYGQDLKAAEWPTLTLGLLLLADTSTYAPSMDDTVLADLDLGSNEVAEAGYVRTVVEGATVTQTADGWRFDVESTVFAAIATGHSAAGSVLYVNVDDDDSLSPWVRIDITDLAAFDSGPFTVNYPAGVLVKENG